jgi:hypothetical protein
VFKSVMNKGPAPVRLFQALSADKTLSFFNLGYPNITTASFQVVVEVALIYL